MDDLNAMKIGKILKSQKGKYKIVSDIGSGSFGHVYKAEYTPKGSKHVYNVAVKKVIANIGNENDAEFMKIMKGKSDHIIEYQESFEDNTHLRIGTNDSAKHLYIVMEYCDKDLDDLIVEQKRDRKRFPSNDIRDFIYQIADGVAALHENRIVHRDLKPSNILISEKEGKKILKITDFGLSKLVPMSLRGGSGTVPYMSPEQFREHEGGRKCDYRVKIWY